LFRAAGAGALSGLAAPTPLSEQYWGYLLASLRLRLRAGSAEAGLGATPVERAAGFFPLPASIFARAGDPKDGDAKD
ncbi:MAG TPA: hypothetical protein VNW97_18385, partial [Candidatus Saccharimonadales bacterium]|nr:hypothetical protein [Candidatus Saccharimonadales bacterium]